jgi:HEAT repeat protein
MAMALGREESKDSLEPLYGLTKSSRPDDRLRGIIGIGRLGLLEASPWLEQRIKEDPLARELEALILAMGMIGTSAHVPTLVEQSRSNQDPIRRASAAALGLSRTAGENATARLLELLKDQDPLVRMISLRGLAHRGVSADTAKALTRLKRPSLSEEEEAEWVFAELIARGQPFRTDLKASASPRSMVRAATAGAAFAVGGTEAMTFARGLISDPHSDVVLVALLAVIGLPGEGSGLPGLLGFVNHSDEQVREAALLGEVYSRGVASRANLEDCLSEELKDDVRRNAKELLSLMDRWPDAVSEIAWARLQTLFDDTGWAASFTVHRSVNELLMRLLGVAETGLFRGRRIPLPSTGGEVAPRRVNPEEEDLRRHLERHPYFDRREFTEFARPHRRQ